MIQNFRLLWDTLSKPGIVARNIKSYLLEIDSPILPSKLSQAISGYPGVKNRNILQTDLQILADLVFEDIITAKELEEEFLDKCYCQSGALSQYALISKKLLSKRYEALFSGNEYRPTVVPAQTKKGVSSELIAESFSKRPILILGDVGVGKTMFFRHFIKVEANDIFRDAILIYIDFGSKAAFAKDIRDFVLDEIERQLKEDYNVDVYESGFVRGIYHGDLMRFSKSIYGELKDTDPTGFKHKEIEFLENKLSDKEQHLISVLSHISKGRKQQVVIFLDNADQRSDEIQQHVFIISQSVAANWPATAFLALRPETFHRSKQLGSMSAYHLKAFSISPPRIDHVISKRLEFGKDITDGKIKPSLLPSGILIDFSKVEAFLSIVHYSLSQSDEIVECIDNLAGGNVRLGLEFIRRLIGSGHIDTKKILSIYEKSGDYLIRLPEFLRTIIFGDNIYYDPNSSPIFNLFDLSSADRKDHFISLIALQYIEAYGTKSKMHGFVSQDDIYNFLQSLSFTVQQIDRCLSELCKSKLLESAGRVKPISEDVKFTSLRITTIGAYHLQRLPYMFVYYDAIVTDLHILDIKYREAILDVYDIHERLKRCEVLLSYLEICSQSLPANSGIDLNKMFLATRQNIRYIKDVLDKRDKSEEIRLF